MTRALVITCVLLLGGALVNLSSHRSLDEGERASRRSLRIVVPFADDIRDFDTARITRDYQYMLLQALYSPLLEHDYSSSQIVTGLAASFHWEGSRFIISLRKGIETQSGYEITADDVVFTFARQLQLNSNTHGDLRRLLCESSPPGELEAKVSALSCQNIEKLDRYTVAFNLLKKNADIVRSLTSIDFAIIPITAVDPLTLKIRNYAETSGPLYYGGQDEKGQIILKAQRGHWHRLAYAEAILFSDYYVERAGRTEPRSVEAFQKGEVDLIPTGNIYSYSPDYYGLDFAYDLHVTNAIGLSYLHLTARGRARPASERRVWAQQIQDHLAAHADRLLPRRTLTRQFFMEEGFGGLDTQRQKTLAASLMPLSQVDESSMTIAVHEGIFASFQRLFGDLPLVKLVREGVNTPTSAVDARVAMIDSSFDEDINYLEYLFKEDFFPFQGAEGEKWLETYAAEADEGRRDALVQDLHLAMIHQNPSVIPLFARPYVACSRRPWTLRLPKNYVNTPFWLIH